MKFTKGVPCLKAVSILVLICCFGRTVAAENYYPAPVTVKTKETADLNGDGVVNILDLVILANAFGKESPDLRIFSILSSSQTPSMDRCQ